EGVAEPGQDVRAVLAEERRNAADGRPDAIPRHRQPDTLVVGQARMTAADQDAALARLRLGQRLIDGQDWRRRHTGDAEDLDEVGGLSLAGAPRELLDERGPVLHARWVVLEPLVGRELGAAERARQAREERVGRGADQRVA